MNLDQARECLAGCVRDELRDHAYGYRDLVWCDHAGRQVADGYTDGVTAEVFFLNAEGDDFRDSFHGAEARQLLKLGQLGVIERGDEHGPEEYTEAGADSGCR